MTLRNEAERSRARRSLSKQQTETRQQRERRLKKGRADRQQLREGLSTDPDSVLTFQEWCALNGFSVRQGRRILSEPGGPKVTRLSERRIGVSRRNNRLWQQSCEAGE